MSRSYYGPSNYRNRVLEACRKMAAEREAQVFIADQQLIQGVLVRCDCWRFRQHGEHSQDCAIIRAGKGLS